MKKAFTRAFCVLVCFVMLFSFSAPALADGLDIGTTVSIIVDSIEITSKTEDCTLKVGDTQVLQVTVSHGVQSYLWELSKDGGENWVEVGKEVDYSITNAQKNTPANVPYQYRVTVTNASGTSASAIIRVLVSDDYSYRTIVLRNGDTEVTSYMHGETRLVVTPLPENSPAAEELASKLADGCLPLVFYDVKLVNQNNDVVPYFGSVEVKFHVGSQYDSKTLRVFHLRDNTVMEYSGEVLNGELAIMVTGLSPFMVEIPAATTHTVTVSAGAGGSVTPSGTVNVADGSDKTFTLLPDVGYEISAVTVNGTPLTITGNSFTLSNITENKTVFVSFQRVTPSEVLHTVTINAQSHGSVYPSGEIQVRHGSAQTIYFYPEVTPNRYEIDKVLVNGNEVNVIGNSFTLSAVTADTQVTVSFREGGSQPPDVYKTISASAGANGSISPMGDVRVEYGGDMYFYFIPNDGYKVDTVFIDDVATAVSGNSYHFVNVVDAHTISVSFKRNVTPPPPTIYHIITAVSGANGSISPSGSLQVPEGGAQTFSFIPDAGYEIDTVLIDGVVTAVSGSAYTFTGVAASHTISVTFKRSFTPPPPPPSPPIPTTYHTITADSGANGSISPVGSILVSEGGTQTFVFIPDTGYEVDTVTIDGALVNAAGNTYRFANVTRNHTIYVTFKRSVTPPSPLTYYTITADSGANGRISPAGNVLVAESNSQNFYLIPDTGYEVETVTVDGKEADVSGTSYRFADVTSNHTISVTFKKTATPAEPIEYHTITAGSGENGVISPNGEARIAEGCSAYFYFMPNEGYEVDAVTVDGKKIAVEEYSYCFENVKADHSIYVTFKEVITAPEPTVYHIIHVLVDGNGSISPSGDVQVSEGGAQTFYLIAGEGYEVEAIYVNGEKQDVVGDRFTVDGVSGDMELRVSFKPVSDSISSAPHCFLCDWVGRDIAPWCWLIPIILVAAFCVALWLLLHKRQK